MDLVAEKCRFKNKETHRKSLEEHLNDEQETVKRLQFSRDAEGNPTHFVLPHTNRDLGLGKKDQEDTEL